MLVPVSMVEAYGAVELQLQAILSLELLGGEWSAHAVHVLPLGKESPVPMEYEAGCAPQLVCHCKDCDHDCLIVHRVAWILH